MQQLAKRILNSSFLALSLLTAQAHAAPASIEGTVSIVYEDYIDESRSQLRYFVKDTQGKSTEILLDKQPNWLKSGQKIRLQGNPQGKKFIAEEETLSLLQSTETSSTESNNTESAAQKVSGSRSVLVVEVHSPAYDVEMITAEMIQDKVFTQSNQFFQEASYGSVSLIGDISAPIVVDYNINVCDTADLATKADVQLRNNGFEPNNYDHVMYLIPYYGKCGWSGKGNVEGPRTWIKRFTTRVINHELGHNLGLYHSNKKDCGTQVTDGSSCSVTEYGDVISAMGSSNFTNHFNSFHKEQLGWLDNKIITLTNDGTATLAPLEINSSSPQALKVLKNVDTSGNAEYYYIEYRQAIGFDDNLATNYPHYLDGVRLREGKSNNPNSSLLLDTTPESNSEEAYDWYDISIHPGQTYSDSKYGIDISVISSGANGVTIEVNYGGNGGNSCTAQTPSITALTSNASDVQAGDNLSFSYRVTNNDSSECVATNFDISSSLPSGWVANLSQNQLNLTAGSSTTVTLNASVASNAAEGNYSLSAKVQRTNSNSQVTASNSVQVVSSTYEPTNQAPVALSDSQIISSKVSTTINVLTNDYDPDGDSLNLVSATQGNKGNVYINTDGTITYVPSKRFKSSDSFSYTVSDGQLSTTATVSISLQASDGGDTGGGGGGKGGGKGRK